MVSRQSSGCRRRWRRIKAKCNRRSTENNRLILTIIGNYLVSIQNSFRYLYLIFKILEKHIRFKAWSQLLLVSRVKAFALPGKSKRATPKAPRQCSSYTPSIFMDTVIIIHLIGRSRCFVFDLPLKLRSSNTPKPKRTVTPFYVYASNPPMPLGLSV